MIAKSLSDSSQADCLVFLDAENVSATHLLPQLRQEVARLGDCVCLLAYGVPDSHRPRYTAEGFGLPIVPPNRTRQKNFIDQQITIDAIEMAIHNPTATTFVIVSGDGDFVPLVVKLQSWGRRVIQIASSSNVSRELMLAADDSLRLPRRPNLAFLTQTPWPERIVVEWLGLLDQMPAAVGGVNLADLGNAMSRKFGFSPQKDLGVKKWRELCEILAGCCGWQVRDDQGVVLICPAI